MRGSGYTGCSGGTSSGGKWWRRRQQVRRHRSPRCADCTAPVHPTYWRHQLLQRRCPGGSGGQCCLGAAGYRLTIDRCVQASCTVAMRGGRVRERLQPSMAALPCVLLACKACAVWQSARTTQLRCTRRECTPAAPCYRRNTAAPACCSRPSGYRPPQVLTGVHVNKLANPGKSTVV